MNSPLGIKKNILGVSMCVILIEMRHYFNIFQFEHSSWLTPTGSSQAFAFFFVVFHALSNNEKESEASDGQGAESYVEVCRTAFSWSVCLTTKARVAGGEDPG